ncbi:2-isopropylmalate synthase [Magnetovibrio blakemorei]|uniref:2-isopropylmalate synthase n=1 Tax=Magnetovibrio blakemorei TaxID=28181 RepID=A0A1E5Q344_9PROT|nr:2-isopropylmalate synthase [Magnetovibrio blakemorei]OEJ63875.1 hypothetical protein BEN30_17140 [Magnetovibrio blakemorei]
MNTKKNRIVVFDTTLRDGEQAPGATMSLDDKLRVASVLEGMGVDVIEAGFPISSDGDFEAVREVAKQVKTSIVCGLSRAVKMDIERCAEAIEPAQRGRIHIVIATSELHMKSKLQMTSQQVYDRIKDSVTYARKFTDDVEWSAEDASRSDRAFLARCVEAAIECGARTVNIPDTVGYAIPSEFADLIRYLFNTVPNIDKAVVSVHCHNDLGMAVANSLAAIDAGVRQVECTVNGLGERGGNAAMEEIVMALRTRHDLMPYDTGVVSTDIMKVSRLVSAVTGFRVQPNKAIVGSNAFAQGSTIYQGPTSQTEDVDQIMTAKSVGWT